jgi:hypothetical protein
MHQLRGKEELPRVRFTACLTPKVVLISDDFPTPTCEQMQIRPNMVVVRRSTNLAYDKNPKTENVTGQRQGSERACGYCCAPGTDAEDFVSHRWQRRSITIRIGGIPLLPEVIRHNLMDHTIGYFLLACACRSWRITTNRLRKSCWA